MESGYRKTFIRPIGPNVETRDMAKYFVPAATIAASRFFYEIYEFIFAHAKIKIFGRARTLPTVYPLSIALRCPL